VTVNVGDVMSGNLLTADSTTPLQHAARQMDERGTGAILICKDSSLVGILTERDVLRAVAQGGVEGTSVAAWMTRDPETVPPDEPVAAAAGVMLRGGFRHLPVVDGSGPIGIVSIRDLMRVVVEE
jgi:CBS domain-containing protein